MAAVCIKMFLQFLLIWFISIPIRFFWSMEYAPMIFQFWHVCTCSNMKNFFLQPSCYPLKFWNKTYTHWIFAHLNIFRTKSNHCPLNFANYWKIFLNTSLVSTSSIFSRLLFICITHSLNTFYFSQGVFLTGIAFTNPPYSKKNF